MGYRFQGNDSIPPFSSLFVITDTSAQPGRYKVLLTAQGEQSGNLILPCYITVNPTPECTSTLHGKAHASSLCVGPNYFDSLSRSMVPNRIIFHNFENSGIQLYADVRCASDGVKIPPQEANGKIYSGEGYHYIDENNQHKVNIFYYKTENGVQTHCAVYLILQ
jgi:hypothetical protein